MNSLFRQLDSLIKKVNNKNSYCRYGKAAVGALDTIIRKVPIVTKTAPHIRDALDLKRYMSIVVIALLPCLFWGMYNAGRCAYLSIGQTSFSIFDALYEGSIHVIPLVLISYAVGGWFEIMFAQVREHEVAEGFLVTGMLYPLVCPVTIPWWIFSIGIIFGCIIAKEVFGGTGMNVLNPALTARAFLFFAYPAEISGEVWIKKPVVKAGFNTFIPVPPKTSLPITTAKTTETANIHNGTSTGIIRGINIPETK
jgi:Na+-transporting NADH:ubiquinone oxidoreductase subunit B